MSGAIQVTLEGKGPVTLRPSDHVATGGEGSIYRVSDMVVKIYTDPGKMAKSGMIDKIKALTVLQHRCIVAPRGLAVDSAKGPVGYYMPYVDGHPLARVFTTEFHRREKFTSKHASTLVDRMREVFVFAHGHKAILVDPNELNWFAQFTGGDPDPRIVDVDSWSIGRWPPTVVMPSVRDWHAKKFDERTDWFAWGVVTFQVYTGIHPYKGTLDGYARGDLENRMRANASVFTPGVRLNQAVRDFSCIPTSLLSWYEATFQKGERTEPPSPFDKALATPRAIQVLRVVTTAASGMLVYEKLFGFPGDEATRIFPCGLALLASNKLVDLATRQHSMTVASSDCEVIRVRKGWLAGWVERGSVRLEFIRDGGLRSEILPFSVKVRQLVGYENRMFGVTDQGLMEIKCTQLGDRVIASAGQTWGILVNSTKWFDGCGVIDAMGAKFVIAPFGDAAVTQTRVRELDGVQVIAGKAGNRFVSLIYIDKSGTYQKIELTFNHDYSSYKVWSGVTDGPELNLAILPKGVCATILEDGTLAVFAPTSGSVTKVEDRQIATDMILSNWGDLVTYIQRGEVWSLRMNSSR
ncbi:MAG: hypothetical protein Q7S84_03180 [bacterium]|nr:hypothetical protein [bacterium]